MFLLSSYLFDELEEHREELSKKSGLSPAGFDMLLSLLLQKVEIVPKDTILRHHDMAIELVKDIDIDDAAFISCALAYPGSILWSNDRRLKEQKAVWVMDTKEMVLFL